MQMGGKTTKGLEKLFVDKLSTLCKIINEETYLWKKCMWKWSLSLLHS